MKRKPGYFCNKFAVLSLTISLCFMVVGCDAAWNAVTRGSLEADIVELALQCGVKISNPTCNMIGSTRQGYCIFEANEQQITALVNGLKLNKVKTGLSLSDLTEEKDMQTKDNLSVWGLEDTLKPFELFKVSDKAKISAFFIGNRPNQLHLKGGSAFDYLLLYYDPVTSQAAIFVCYSYG